MNRNILIALGALVLLILIGAGTWFFFFRSENAKPAGNTGGTSAPQAETMRDHGAYYDITAKYPKSVPFSSSVSAEAQTKASATLAGFVTTEVATFKRENIDTLSADDIRIMGLNGERKYGLDIDYDVHTGPRTISYVFSVFADTLGAHPNTYYRTFTFDTVTGAELSLADLFTQGAPYLQTVSDLSRTQLTASIAKASNVSVSEINTEYLDSGTEPNAANFQWFYIDGTTLALLFPPYQVGPYALGTQEVRVLLSSLSGISATYK